MRLLLLIGLLVAQTSSAQRDAPPEPAIAAAASPAPYAPSPEWTQDRSFTSTRFWRLDPGQYEVQSWLRTRIPHEMAGVRAPAELRLQQEIEIGLTPHLQLDLYENLTFNVEDTGRRGVQQEGLQIEARISFGERYGQLFGNPVLYLEWHPHRHEPDRAEVRLLLGGELSDSVYLAVNPYFETNIAPTEGRWLLDAEVGTTVALGLRLSEWLRISAELKIGADMLGDDADRFHFVAWGGPGFILKPLPGRFRKHLKIMGTLLIALPGTPPQAQQFEPLVILGSQF